jgi:hypothetical protein
MQDQIDDEVPGIDRHLVSRLVDAYGMDPVLAERVVEETFLAYGDTVEEWVRSRHIRLQRQGLSNETIYRLISREISQRRFSSEPLSLRQIRRLIYG